MANTISIGNSSQFVNNVRTILNIGIGHGLYKKSSFLRDDTLMRNEGKTRYGIDSSSLISKEYGINIIGNMGGTPRIGQSTSLYENENHVTKYLDDEGGLLGFTDKEDMTNPDSRITKGAKFRDELFNNEVYEHGASFIDPGSTIEMYSVDEEVKDKINTASIDRVDYKPFLQGRIAYTDENENLEGPSNYADNRALRYTHYNEKNIASKDETHVLDEFDTFDFNDSIGNTNVLFNNHTETLVKKTNNLFRQGKIGSLISRFSTGADFMANEYPTAKTGNGMSRGRNLLKVKPTQHNGYTNPYCRVWTSHYQYSKFSDTIRPFQTENGVMSTAELQKDYGGFRPNSGNTYLNDHSVLMSETGMPKICPKEDDVFTYDDSTNKEKLKKCMFSIENLAWKGHTDKLRESQRGEFGGRIMWFPPYNLSFSETVNTRWVSNDFIGRGEQIYSYANTERGGTLKFSILVDHPSSVDMYLDSVKRNGSNIPEREIEQKILRYFAGCDILEIDSDKICTSVVTKESGITSAYTETEIVPEDEYIDVCFPIFYPNNYSAVDYQGGKKEQVQCHHPDKKRMPVNDLDSGVTYIYNTYESYETDLSKIGQHRTKETSDYYAQDYKWSDQYLKDEEKRDMVNYGLNTILFSNWINYFEMTDEGLKELKTNTDEIKSAYEYAAKSVLGIEANKYPVISFQELYNMKGKDDLFNVLTLIKQAAATASGKTPSEEYDVEFSEELYREYWNTNRAETVAEEVITFGQNIASNLKLTEEIFDYDLEINDYKKSSLSPTAYIGISESEYVNEEIKKYMPQNYSFILSSFNEKYGSDFNLLGTDKVYEIKRFIQSLMDARTDVIYGEDKEQASQGEYNEKYFAVVKKQGSGNTPTNTLIASEYEAKTVSLFGGASEHGREEWNNELCNDRWNTILMLLKMKGIIPADFLNDNVKTGKAISVVSTPIAKWTIGKESLPTAKAGRCAYAVVRFCKTELAKKKAAVIAAGTNRSETIISEDGKTITEKRFEQDTNGRIKLITITSSMTDTEIEETCEDRYNYQDEYMFFKNLEHNDSVAYKSLVRKLKYFNPAFHSLTPEGLNARLTFLHQCTRQGPTYSASDGNSDAFEHSIGAGNLSFGESPYCILRIGDFYYTKIIIENISIDYEGANGLQWDMNQEGIGMQPMMADVNLSFKFIGGSDLAGPISKLQNAVSANYYANTSVYDASSDKYDEKLDNINKKK